MNNFFDNLSFKQKIIFGFSLLSAILLFGMGYMLLEFTNVSNLSANIIEKHQPVTRSASNALEHSKSAANHLHKFLLDAENTELEKYSESIEKVERNLKTLSEYAGSLELEEKDIQRAQDIVSKINKHVKEIERYNNHYEENHPVINAAASLLNPLALEYLGMLNTLISENTNSKLSKKILIDLTEIRHTWSQMLSSLRITLATRQAREFINVKTYAEINQLQMERIKKMKLDLGLEGIEDLEKIRKLYMEHLEKVISTFNSKIWRMDAHIMTNQVMPLFDELDDYFKKLSNIQLEQSKKADLLLSDNLDIAHYTYITLILIGLITAFLISSFITHSLRRPLKKLVTATKEVASGNLQAGLKVKGNDEIADLTRAFNDMVSNLYISQQALTTARDVAEHANRAKSQFLTRMSHELRTPLNAILGFAQLLEINTAKISDSSDHEYVNNILKSGWHLLELVEEVLDLSQIETNTALIHKENVDVFPLLHECIETIRPMVDEHKLKITVEIESKEECYLDIDPLRFKQIILNLLTNAVKYNRKDGNIIISSECIANRSLIISVSDEGDGLTKEQQQDAFEAFQRFDADERAIGGTGIGLNITKNLVELMGGEIGVRSEKGQGSCFWVEFPINGHHSDSPEIPAVISKEQVTDGIECTLLYVEDDVYNLELVREIISVLHPEMILLEASTAEEGLQIAEKELPRLILMDLNLPGMSGQEALEKLKQNPATRNIPVVAISADAVMDTIKQGRKLGFIDYITKPIKVNEFMGIVESIIMSNK